MFEALAHPADFQFAQECLEQDAPALAAFEAKYHGAVTRFLLSVGAPPQEAADVIAGLWSDCVAPSGDRPAKLRNYNGESSLLTWLNRVAINQWVMFKRFQKRWNKLVPETFSTGGQGEGATAKWRSIRAPENISEAPLMALMGEALQAAFTDCPPRDFVIVQLMHCDGLRCEEVARIFDCSVATVSRHVKQATDGIRQATLAHIRQTDPWLELKWDDFMELCRGATPACFGVD